ncbi:MAG: lipid A hydroxylase LpxO [Gammaproteobacteria bacterium HGW-Gammaproteobacteria-5]|jgi:beta-hydroxylase|nr:MAG: lipid A hydroxylase LpxO [Gammaproteobacteria bacterium HGW-Gammaproteobacteria-5]
MKWLIVGVWVACAAYFHLRGKARLRLGRQLADHSSVLAPLNVLLCAASPLPITPFLPRDQFPALDALRDNWETIRDEALALADNGDIRAATGYNDVGFNSFFRWGWKRFYLKWYDDAPHPSAMQTCPKTLALLQAIPSVKAAMFTLLPPGSQLRPHRDPYAGSVRYHLGLITPNDPHCFIEVDGEPYAWHDGEDVMFDETFVHRAFNHTDKTRIILFCDVERPMRFAWMATLNRAVARTLLSGGRAPNRDGDPTGALGHAFGYFYRWRLLNKALKERQPKVYYGLKYLALSGLLVLLIMV